MARSCAEGGGPSRGLRLVVGVAPIAGVVVFLATLASTGTTLIWQLAIYEWPAACLASGRSPKPHGRSIVWV